MKGWGKSPPRAWQQGRHGKPRLEQDRIGTSRGFGRRVHRPRHPGRSREPFSNGGSRGMIVAVFGRYRTRLTGRLTFSFLADGPGPGQSGSSISIFCRRTRRLKVFFAALRSPALNRVLIGLEGDAQPYLVAHRSSPAIEVIAGRGRLSGEAGGGPLLPVQQTTGGCGAVRRHCSAASVHSLSILYVFCVCSEIYSVQAARRG